MKTKKWPTGTEIGYYVSCPTELWWFSHKIQMEQNSELVKLGKLIHEKSFNREKKNLIIDNKILLDFVKLKDGVVIHEVKKSSKLEESHRIQLQYYLYYLKKEKNLITKGIIDYPAENKKIEINLTESEEKRLEEIIKETINVIYCDKPPTPTKKKRCKKCSYYELCWSE